MVPLVPRVWLRATMSLLFSIRPVRLFPLSTLLSILFHTPNYLIKDIINHSTITNHPAIHPWQHNTMTSAPMSIQATAYKHTRNNCMVQVREEGGDRRDDVHHGPHHGEWKRACWCCGNTSTSSSSSSSTHLLELVAPPHHHTIVQVGRKIKYANYYFST